MADEENAEPGNYQQLISVSPAPINLFDESGEIIWGNDAVLDLLGLDSREDLIGRSIFDFIVAEDQYTAEQELVDVVKSKTATGPTPMQLRRADGEIRSIRVSTAPGRFRGRDIGQAVVIDVTELERAHEELETERQFVQNALNALPDVFYVITPGGELDRWNDSLLDVSGYDAEEVRAMDIEDFFVESHTERISESIATAFAEGADTVEATVVTKQGREIPFEFRKRRLVDGEDVIGLAGIGRDISERKAREQHLRAVDYLLQHNLRNQINIIQGSVELVSDASSAQGQSAAERIDAAAERLLSIFDNHHLIIDQLTTPQPTESIDVVAALEAIARECGESYPAATITTDLPERAGVSGVHTLKLALRELVENAIEHNERREPQIEIDVEHTDPRVVIRVSDDGPPIPEMEYRSFSEDSLLDSTYHSAGFGLWFVYHAVRQSGGSLHFDRGEKRGNVVTIDLS
ncbi:PAS domain-containing sensor histidine kinase [Halobellus limi]|uniref:histidine kinase n=1 Tax=Halobellus limi TaxID=699433 RepID=A0A1H5TQ36_9EURY|nr:PAS domain-containing sensor histidine kinase [Halobellus limi]QCC47274.1 PAS domain-containing sensor histidine kinase [Halobellus limi]SEF64117.1 PAS domain S-box-containing protein [Halobellus limi]